MENIEDRQKDSLVSQIEDTSQEQVEAVGLGYSQVHPAEQTDRESSCSRPASNNVMATSLKNVKWTIEGQEEQQHHSDHEEGEQSPYSTKIIAINQELERLEEATQQAHELSYSQDESDRGRRSQSAAINKKPEVEGPCEEEQTDKQAVSYTEPQPPPNSERNEPVQQSRIVNEPVLPESTKPSEIVVAIPAETVDVGPKKKKMRNSKKRYITSGTHLLDQYEVADAVIHVDEPSSKALLSKCKSQDCLLPQQYFKKKKPSSNNKSSKKNEPVKVTQHLRSMKKALRDSIKEDDHERQHGLPSISSEKALVRLNRQLRTLNVGHSNKILPMFYSPKSIYNSSPESPKINKFTAAKQKGFGQAERQPFPKWQERLMKQNPAPGAYESAQIRSIAKGPSFGLSHKYYEKVLVPKLDARSLPRRQLTKLHR